MHNYNTSHFQHIFPSYPCPVYLRHFSGISSVLDRRNSGHIAEIEWRTIRGGLELNGNCFGVGLELDGSYVREGLELGWNQIGVSVLLKVKLNIT